VATFPTDESISITVRMPRRAWPTALKPPARHGPTSIKLIWGRLTNRETVMVIRAEGTTHQIQEAVHFWEYRGFSVEVGARKGTMQAHGKLGNYKVPHPSLCDRGSPSRGSLDPLPGATGARFETL